MAPYSMEELEMIIAPIAKRYGVQSVSVFGSYSKGTASATSDVDLKIEKGQLRSLFQLSGFRLAVEDALKLPVNLVTSESADHAFLDSIGDDEVQLYRKAGDEMSEKEIDDKLIQSEVDINMGNIYSQSEVDAIMGVTNTWIYEEAEEFG